MKQLDPKAVWLFFIGAIGRGFIIGALLSFWVGAFISGVAGDETPGAVYYHSGLLMVLVLPLALLIIAYIWARLSYRFYKYEVGDKGFRKESGVIWKRYVTIPYDRIQNVDIYRGVIARLLGLSDLQIHTAGMGGIATGEGRLPGLSKEEAERMRDELIDRSRTSRTGQGL